MFIHMFLVKRTPGKTQCHNHKQIPFGMGMVYGIGQIWNVHYQTRPWIFQMGHTGVFINRGTPKWTVYNGISKNPSING